MKKPLRRNYQNTKVTITKAQRKKFKYTKLEWTKDRKENPKPATTNRQAQKLSQTANS